MRSSPVIVARSLFCILEAHQKEFVTHTCTSLDAVIRVAVRSKDLLQSRYPHAKILQAAVASVCHVHATSAAISQLTVTQASWFLLPYYSVRGPLLPSQRVCTLLVSEPHEAKQQPR